MYAPKKRLRREISSIVFPPLAIESCKMSRAAALTSIAGEADTVEAFGSIAWKEKRAVWGSVEIEGM